ncbi:mpv17-like protein [Bemisia tabaci]
MVLSFIKQAFQKRPMLANSVVYGTMCVGAEFSQQYVTKRILDKKAPPEPIDKASLARYTVLGTCINPNILYFWYKWLDKNFVGTAKKVVVKKVLIDQFCMTPPLYVIFYVSMSLMEGKRDLLAECREKFIPTFQTSCVFWLPAQAVNFMLVPPAARVVYVGTCSFLWINILCWIKRRDFKPSEEA